VALGEGPSRWVARNDRAVVVHQLGEHGPPAAARPGAEIERALGMAGTASARPRPWRPADRNGPARQQKSLAARCLRLGERRARCCARLREMPVGQPVRTSTRTVGGAERGGGARRWAATMVSRCRLLPHRPTAARRQNARRCYFADDRRPSSPRRAHRRPRRQIGPASPRTISRVRERPTISPWAKPRDAPLPRADNCRTLCSLSF